jgi:hypothetical protein
MTCQCGAEALDDHGALKCLSCGTHCLDCACARPADIAIPDRREPMPDGLGLWSDGSAGT